MTKISHIVSSDLLDLIDGRDFYMCLANIASKDENYCNFYKKKVEDGAFVLLDNGAAEADQMTLEVMWSVIEKINPSEVILNDCLMDCEETVRRSIEAINFYKSRGYKGQYLFVPQGQNLREWIMCYELMKDYCVERLMDSKCISTIGVSKFVTKGWKDSEARYSCCSYLSYEKPQVHLLGCHENINEVAKISKQFDFIRSNDTAISYIYALSNKKITDGDRPSGEINFIKSDLDEQQIEILKENMQTFDNLFKNE